MAGAQYALSDITALYRDLQLDFPLLHLSLVSIERFNRTLPPSNRIKGYKRTLIK